MSLFIMLLCRLSAHISVTHLDQAILGIEGIFPGIAGKLELRRLKDRRNRTGINAETAEHAAKQVQFVRIHELIMFRPFGSDHGYGLGRAYGLAQTAPNACSRSRFIAPHRMEPSRPGDRFALERRVLPGDRGSQHGFERQRHPFRYVNQKNRSEQLFQSLHRAQPLFYSQPAFFMPAATSSVPSESGRSIFQEIAMSW